MRPKTACDNVVELVERARDTDSSLADRHDAYAELVTRYQDMAYGYAYALLGDSACAKDAAQEAFLLAYQRLYQLSTQEAFPAWLRRIVASRCSRLLRAESHTPCGLDEVAEPVSPRPDPYAELERKELARHVMAAVRALPEHERITTILYYINGYSQREVADFMDVSLPAVKKRLERARGRLLESLVQTVGEQLMEQKPSRDDRFVQEVKLSLLMEAVAQGGQYATLELLLVDGYDVNTRSAEGQTLLHWAAEAGHLEAIELLTKNGANALLRDGAGYTPRQLAERNGHAEAAALLRQAEG
ncbi:MAG: sigma-70 family RNA polymerase sigma factor [Anaerolineae bacterium]